MISALDTNILLDLLVPGSRFHEQSAQWLTAAFDEGALVVSEPVYAELAAWFPDQPDLDRFLANTRIQVEPASRQALYSAGQAWRTYASRRPTVLVRPRCGASKTVTCDQCGATLQPRQHVLADFLIGAHALYHADRLLTRDRGYYATYFPSLRLE